MAEKPMRRIFLKEFKAISRAISTYEDLGLLIKHIVQGVVKSFKVKACSIMILDEREKQLYTVASSGVSAEYLSKGALFVDEKYSSFFTGKPVFVEDLQNDPRIKYPEDAAKEGFVSMLSVPIKCREAVLGLIRVYNSEPWALHEDDTDSFCVLSEHLGLVIENNGLRNFLDNIKTAMDNLPLRMLKSP